MNFNFINSSALWALPLTLLPVLIHLLFRRPPKRVVFSDLRFLKMVLEKERPRKRIKEWLILLLRVLALLAFLLFFSRPILNVGDRWGKEDSVAMVLLLDNSCSMRAQNAGSTHWQRAVSLAQAALSSLGERDRSALVIYSDRIEYSSGYLTNLHGELSLKLKSMEPNFRGTDVFPALGSAYRILNGSGASNKVILILSDMAAHGWRAGPSVGKDLRSDWKGRIENYDAQVRILYVNLPKALSNAGVNGMDIAPDLYSGSLKVNVDVENFSAEPISALPVYFELRGGELGKKHSSETIINLGPREKKRVSLSAPNPQEEYLTGRVGIRADALSTDDEYYFARRVPEKIKVLCIEEPSGIAALSGESYYLRQALLSPPALFELRVINLSEAHQIQLESYDVVLLINPYEVERSLAEKLAGFLRKGGALFVSLGDHLNYEKIKPLAELLPARLGEKVETQGLSLKFSDLNKEESLNFERDYDLNKVLVNVAVQTVLLDNSEPWLLLSDGTPLLIFSEDGKTALWTTSINRAWNNAASKPLYAPLIRMIFKQLAAKKESHSVYNLTVGEILKTKAAPGMDLEHLRITNPLGAEVRAQVSGGQVRTDPLELPGLYVLKDSLHSNSRELFSVNCDKKNRESDLTAIAAKELKSTLEQTQWSSLDPGPEFAAELAQTLRGKEMSRLLLLLGALLLLAELLVTARKK